MPPTDVSVVQNHNKVPPVPFKQNFDDEVFSPYGATLVLGSPSPARTYSIERQGQPLINFKGIPCPAFVRIDHFIVNSLID
jgi:hypothetical protein